ncbi:MAG TPA: hypothetical protein VF058_00840 [Actinomycetota bacterium]
MRATAVATVLVLASCARLPDPSTLPGEYESTTAPATLTLKDGEWTLDNGGFVKSGAYGISGDRVAFLITETSHPAFDNYCREEADVYEWRFDDDLLVLRAVGDTCDPVGQSVLTHGPWERA